MSSFDNNSPKDEFEIGKVLFFDKPLFDLITLVVRAKIKSQMRGQRACFNNASCFVRKISINRTASSYDENFGMRLLKMQVQIFKGHFIA